jgi:hypothetical protein
MDTERHPGEGGPGSEPGVRQERFTHPGPCAIDVELGAGRVEISLDADDEIHVELRRDTAAAHPWPAGMSNLLSWVGSTFSAQLPHVESDEAPRQARVELTGSRLSVHAPTAPPLKMVPLAVTVHAPSDSTVDVRSGAADVAVRGRSGAVSTTGGGGSVTVEECAGRVTVRTGSGSVRLGEVAGHLQVRGGSGDVEVAAVRADASVITGSGGVRVGTVEADLLVRTGSGNLAVDDAAAGRIELSAGSGEIRVGVRSGCLASVDLNSHAGRARSELDVSDTTPEGQGDLTITGRTGSGDVLLARAAG